MSDEKEKMQELQEHVAQLESKLAETEVMLAQSIDRSTMLNRLIRERDAQINILKKSNEAMQDHLSTLQGEGKSPTKV